MSADNWGVCPKCKDTSKKALEEDAAKLKKIASDSYGKVDPEIYETLLNQYKTAQKKFESLDEDEYETDLREEGTFYVKYSGACQKCSFQFKYTHKEEV